MEKNNQNQNAEFDFKTIDDFAKVCEKCGTTEEKFNQKWPKEKFDKDTIAYEALKLVFRAINNERKPDYNNSDEIRYFSLHWVRSSGSAFVFSYCSYTSSHTILGSRLATFSPEQVYHINKYFDYLWVDFKL